MLLPFFNRKTTLRHFGCITLASILQCKVDDVDGCPLLTWPVIVCHTIDKDSPLYEFSQCDLLMTKFEIHVILDGVVPTNGMNTTAKTSYLPNEIHWGSR